MRARTHLERCGRRSRGRCIGERTQRCILSAEGIWVRVVRHCGRGRADEGCSDAGCGVRGATIAWIAAVCSDGESKGCGSFYYSSCGGAEYVQGKGEDYCMHKMRLGWQRAVSRCGGELPTASTLRPANSRRAASDWPREQTGSLWA